MPLFRVPITGGGRVYSSIRNLSKVVGQEQVILFGDLTPTVSSVKEGDTIIDRLYTIAVVTSDTSSNGSSNSSIPVTTIQAGQFIYDTSRGVTMANYAQRALQDESGNDIQQTYATESYVNSQIAAAITTALNTAV